jgi:LysM repeat protein
MHPLRYILSLFLCFLIQTCLIQSIAYSFELKDDYPRRYVVRDGDTLWGIANRYLKNPWEWKALWHANPRIKNPKKLYAGDILVLQVDANQTYFRVLSNGVIKLSPHIRPMPADNPIPPIQLSDIKPFLNESLVLNEDILSNAPYVVAYNGERLLGGQGDEIFVKNLPPRHGNPRGTTIPYIIFRPEGPYFRAHTKKIIGYKAGLVGYAELVQRGNPATLLLTDIKEGVHLTDRVLVNNQPEFDLYFEPQSPMTTIKASIIDLPGDFTQGAVGFVATIDQGLQAGLRAGDVLGIYAPRKSVPDPLNPNQLVVIPPERVGEIMIFRPFTETSFGLVVRSTRAIQINDVVTNP